MCTWAGPTADPCGDRLGWASYRVQSQRGFLTPSLSITHFLPGRAGCLQGAGTRGGSPLEKYLKIQS